MNAIDKIEPEIKTIHSAMVEVMAQIKRLKKDDQNKHGNYDFTSVDDFKDFVRPLMAKAGLIPHVNQTAFAMIEYLDSKGSQKSVAQFDFQICVEHESGIRTLPEGITVALPFTGAQTSGAARSYAIKEWMKSRYMASSGDAQDEADLIEQAREGLRLSKSDARELHKTLTDEIQSQIDGKDHEALGVWWQENKYRIETLPKDWFITFRTDYATAYKQLKAEYDLDRMTNSDLDEIAQKDEK